MKTSNLIFGLIVLWLLTSCSEDFGVEDSSKTILDIKQEIYDQGDLYSATQLSDYSSVVIGDINDYQEVSLQVFQAVVRNHPDSKIENVITYKNGDEYYSVLLSDDLEGVVFKTGHWLVTATEEKMISENEMIAGELPIEVLMRLYDSYNDETVEEIVATTRGGFRIDFKNGKRAEFDKSGNLKSHGDDDEDDDGTTISISSLPNVIVSYIETNYPGSTIIEAETYPNGYEVELNNGLKLEFDLDGNFREVSGNNGGRDDDSGEGEDEDIDPSALPQLIVDYVVANYPGTSIVEAEIDPLGYEVTLNNGIKLEFDLDGNFIEVSGHSDDDKEDDSDDDDEEIDPAALPQAVLDYISTNYPNETILRAEFDSDGYEVILSNGLKLEFDAEGRLTEISGSDDEDDEDDDSEDNDDEDGENEQDINPENLPQAALDFINEVCPNETIKKAELYTESQIYEVTMNSGLQFEFDIDGNLLEISGSDCDEISISSLPQSIRDYISNEFSSNIDKVKQCDYGYRVDLNDDTRIYLKSNGDVIFVGEDD